MRWLCQEPEIFVGFCIEKKASILALLLYSNTGALAVLNQILCCVYPFGPSHRPYLPPTSVDAQTHTIYHYENPKAL
jgi:hypothetical protein